MAYLRDLPIRRKLFLVGIATSAAAVVLTSVVFLIFSYFILRRNMHTELLIQAAIINDTTNLAVTLGDTNAVQEVLGALQATPSIDRACVYDQQGRRLAAYSRAPLSLPCADAPPPDVDEAQARTIAVVVPITMERKRVGTLHLQSNLTRAEELLWLLAYAGAGGFALCVLGAALIASRLQRVISQPIVSLAEVAAKISSAGDYSLRAEQHGDDEIGVLVRTFNEMLGAIERRDDQLRAASRSKDEFLAVLSHELRTPLNAIVGWLQILRTVPPTPEVMDRALLILERNAHAQTRLIEDLLDVSAIITGKLQLRTSVVDLVGVIEAAIDVTRPSAETKGIALTAHLLSAPRLITGDADRLQQVVWNLLSNAVKFTPTGGHVRVSLTEAGASYALKVQDDGAGIDPEFVPRMFDRFGQADTSMTRRHGGLGLGLAIVRDLVALHGGRVEPSSPGPGQGATFTVLLPQLPAGTGAATGAPARGANERLDALSVLIVDDNPEARMVAATALVQAGARVETVADASEALAALDQRRFDVLVCDLAMPEGDGFSLVKLIRTREPGLGHFTPAVALSAHAGVEDRTTAHEVGYQGFVAKPYEFATLVHAVATAARSHPRRDRRREDVTPRLSRAPAVE